MRFRQVWIHSIEVSTPITVLPLVSSPFSKIPISEKEKSIYRFLLLFDPRYILQPAINSSHNMIEFLKRFLFYQEYLDMMIAEIGLRFDSGSYFIPSGFTSSGGVGFGSYYNRVHVQLQGKIQACIRP